MVVLFQFTFAKIWLLFAQFEIRQKSLQAARKIMVRFSSNRRKWHRDVLLQAEQQTHSLQLCANRTQRDEYVEFWKM